MKQLTLSKKLLVGLFLFVLILILSVAFGWRFLTSRLIENNLNKLIKNPPANVSLNIDNISVKRSFPYLVISINRAILNYNQILSVDIKNIVDRLSVLKFIASYISGRTFYGKIGAAYAIIKYKQRKNIKSGYNVVSIPILPVDIKIDHLKAIYGGYKFDGSLEGVFHPLFKSYKITIDGLLNNLPLNCNAKIKKNYLAAFFNLKIKKIGALNIKNITGNVSTTNFNDFKFDFESDYVSYKSVAFKKPRVSATFERKQKGYLVNNFQLKSENGYLLSFKGFIDKNNYLNSNVSGEISTPYINIQPFLSFVPKKIRDYILKGYISLSDVSFAGKPSIDFIKKGHVYAKSFSFRIDKKSSNFFIKKGTVDITPSIIKAMAQGNFENVLFNNSVIRIHRKKGYPCDMNLKYYGTANDLARVFLEENIFSKNDMKVLGKTSALKGKFSATTKIINYHWKAEPFFNFDIIINSNGVEFYNSNIPSKFIESWGVVEIKRVVRKGRVKTLFVRLKDMKAKGFASTLYTKDFTIFIKPNIVLKGGFNADLSKNDINYLINSLMGKRINAATNGAKITGSINGKLDNFSFKGKINYIAHIQNNTQFPLDLTLQGDFKSHVLKIDNLELNGYMKASGSVDMKTFSFNSNLMLQNFKINIIRSFLSYANNIPIKKGELEGNVKISGDIKKPLQSIQGVLSIKNGYVSKNVNSISGNISFDMNSAHIKNAYLKLFQTPIKLTGSINYDDNMSVNLKAQADNVTVDLNKIDSSKKTKKNYLKLPEFNISSSLDINNLYLKDKNRKKDIGKTRIELKNTKLNSEMKFISRKTRIEISKKGKKIKAYIKDYNIFSFLTNCHKKDNLFELKAKLATQNPNKLDVEDLKGDLDILSKNGEFKNVSSALKLLSATNIIEVIFGKTKLEKNLPYKTLIAPLYFNKGVLKTREKQIAALYGKNLDIFAKGKYGIMKKYVDVYVTITTLRSINRLISKIPIIGWIIGGKEKSFTGVNFHIKGTIGKNMSVKPVPLKGLGEGFFGIIKRALMTPFNAIGVGE